MRMIFALVRLRTRISMSELIDAMIQRVKIQGSYRIRMVQTDFQTGFQPSLKTDWRDSWFRQVRLSTWPDDKKAILSI